MDFSLSVVSAEQESNTKATEISPRRKFLVVVILSLHIFCLAVCHGGLPITVWVLAKKGHLKTVSRIYAQMLIVAQLFNYFRQPLFCQYRVRRMCIYSVSHFPFSFAISISFCPCTVIKPRSIIFIARSLFRFPHLLLGFLGVNFK